MRFRVGGKCVVKVPAVKGLSVSRASGRVGLGGRRMRAANGLWAALALILLPGDSHALREGDCEGEFGFAERGSCEAATASRGDRGTTGAPLAGAGTAEASRKPLRLPASAPIGARVAPGRAFPPPTGFVFHHREGCELPQGIVMELREPVQSINLEFFENGNLPATG